MWEVCHSSLYYLSLCSHSWVLAPISCLREDCQIGWVPVFLLPRPPLLLLQWHLPCCYNWFCFSISLSCCTACLLEVATKTILTTNLQRVSLLNKQMRRWTQRFELIFKMEGRQVISKVCSRFVKQECMEIRGTVIETCGFGLPIFFKEWHSIPHGSDGLGIIGIHTINYP